MAGQLLATLVVSAVTATTNAQTTPAPNCPPMPDGICLAGRALDPTACGVWEDAVTGGRQSVDKRSDAQMYAAGYFCKGVCGDVDAHHRKNAEPNGGPNCSGIYGFYNGDTNCCTKPAPRCGQISREKAARIKEIGRASCRERV